MKASALHCKEQKNIFYGNLDLRNFLGWEEEEIIKVLLPLREDSKRNKPPASQPSALLEKQKFQETQSSTVWICRNFFQ